MTNPNILVVGGIAIDILFPIHGDIRNEIPLKEGKLRSVNMSFLALKSQYHYGGTSGNIAYGLGLLNKNPIMFSAVGEDFKKDYESHLEDSGVICKPIVGPSGSEMAKCFQISDSLHQQITIFQANYYGERIDDMSLLETLKEDQLKKIEYAIFTPGNATSTLNNIIEFKRINNKAEIILDPGMNVTNFSKEDLLESISHSNILISNDVEILRIKTFHGFDIKDLLAIGLDYVIETKGEEGSTIYSKSKIVNIPIIKPKKVIETTGAGDAYRAGLIAGLSEGMEITKAAELGAKLG